MYEGGTYGTLAKHWSASKKKEEENQDLKINTLINTANMFKHKFHKFKHFTMFMISI